MKQDGKSSLPALNPKWGQRKTKGRVGGRWKKKKHSHGKEGHAGCRAKKGTPYQKYSRLAGSRRIKGKRAAITPVRKA